MTLPQNTHPSPPDHDLAEAMRLITDEQFDRRLQSGQRWRTAGIWMLGLGVCLLTPVELFKVLTRPNTSAMVDRQIEEALADLPSLSPATDAEAIARLEKDLARLKGQLNVLVEHQTANSVNSDTTSTATRETTISEPSTDPSYTVLETQRFQVAPGADEGEYALDIPAGYSQPVLADLGEGQNMAINGVPANIRIDVDNAEGNRIAANADGTWNIPSTGDVTIHFNAETDSRGTVTIAVR